MKINKKSQVSVFIILAVIIASLILTAIIYRPKENIKPEINKIDPINSFVLNCIKETGEDAVNYIGYTGGYFYTPNLSTDNNIAYYLYENKNTMPSKESMENELSEYMNNMLFFCTKNFVDFPDFNIKQGEIKTKTTIEEDWVVFNVNYPLSIEKENNTYLFDDFKDTEIPVRLGVVYNSAREIMDEQMFNRDICIGCILKISLKNKLHVYVNKMNDSKVVIFTITDENSKIRDKEFKFNFANKYE